jgi:hypothetical protein
MELILIPTNSIVVSQNLTLPSLSPAASFSFEGSMFLPPLVVFAGQYKVHFTEIPSRRKASLMSFESQSFSIDGFLRFLERHLIGSDVQISWQSNGYRCNQIVPYTLYRWDFDYFYLENNRSWSVINLNFVNLTDLQWKNATSITMGMTNVIVCSTMQLVYTFSLSLDNMTQLLPNSNGGFFRLDGYYAIRLTLPDIGPIYSKPAAVVQKRKLLFLTKPTDIELVLS